MHMCRRLLARRTDLLTAEVAENAEKTERVTAVAYAVTRHPEIMKIAASPDVSRLGVGVLRLRRTMRIAHNPAPLRMTLKGFAISATFLFSGKRAQRKQSRDQAVRD